MAEIYEITISDTDNQECFAELPVSNGTVEFNFHIRRAFGSIYVDVYIDDKLLCASNKCIPDRYVFGYGGYALYYINETTFEWREYDLER